MIARIKALFSSASFAELRSEALGVNEFFTPEFIDYAVKALEDNFLNQAKVQEFVAEERIARAFTPAEHTAQSSVGILCAGNLPLVGFGDMFYALLCGCSVVLKVSRRDPLMRIFGELDNVEISESIDSFAPCAAIVAMGGDEVCAILESRFPSTPSLLRGQMHSVAVLSGKETPSELKLLANDMFLYCSMGCRSVTHLYLPRGYNLSTLTTAIEHSPLTMPKVWHDNYRYERARATLSGEQFTDGGYFLLKEDSFGAPQPLTVVSYSFYDIVPELEGIANIQHIATARNFGTAQTPTLSDFSGGLSVIEFLDSVSA